MRRLLLSVVLVPVTVLLACTGQATNVDDPPAQVAPGRISLSYADGLAKSVRQQKDVEDTSVFALGDIKASRDFYFELRNVGGKAIRELTLASSNPHFTVTPGSLRVLPPDSIAALTTILRISAIHGTSLDGVGFTALMPADTNRTMITICGVTSTRNGADTVITTFAILTVNALLADITLLSNNKPVNLTAWWMTASCPYGGLVMARIYEVTNASIVNTGNVQLVLSAPNFGDLSIDTLAPGDTATVPPTVYGPSGYALLRIDGKNTVADNRKLQLGNDGAGYLILH